MQKTITLLFISILTISLSYGQKVEKDTIAIKSNWFIEYFLFNDSFIGFRNLSKELATVEATKIHLKKAKHFGKRSLIFGLPSLYLLLQGGNLSGDIGREYVLMGIILNSIAYNYDIQRRDEYIKAVEIYNENQ